MSTTVFPVTDQTATAALWQSMASTLDRGSVDGLTDHDSAYDGDKLQWDSDDDQVGLSALSARGGISVNIGLGECIFFEGAVSIIGTDDTPTPDPGDSIDIRFTPSSGVNIYGANASHASANSTRPVCRWFKGEGSFVDSYLAGASSTGTTSRFNETAGLFWFIAYGATAGGTITVEWIEGSDDHSDDNDVGIRHIVGRRIIG